MNQLGTRAVLRPVEAGQAAPCAGCGRNVMFSAWARLQRQVVANVYGSDGRWARVEIWHAPCYRDAGEPHGAAS